MKSCWKSSSEQQGHVSHLDIEVSSFYLDSKWGHYMGSKFEMGLKVVTLSEEQGYGYSG